MRLMYEFSCALCSNHALEPVPADARDYDMARPPVGWSQDGAFTGAVSRVCCVSTFSRHVCSRCIDRLVASRVTTVPRFLPMLTHEEAHDDPC